MNKYSFFLFLLFSACLTVHTLEAAPLTDEQQHQLLSEGVKLHDQGKYKEAVEKYKQVLSANPENELALYELAFSYSSMGDFENALKTCSRGIELGGSYLPNFYMIQGNVLDDTNQYDDALQAYENGIELLPDYYLLHFNLALLYLRHKEAEKALDELILSAGFNPGHASSHYYLAIIYYNMNYKVPALLASIKYLILEPAKERSPNIHKIMQDVFSSSTETTITMDSTLSEEMAALDLMLGICIASALSDAVNKDKELSDIERQIEVVSITLKIMNELLEKKNYTDFVWTHYLPYFTEMQKSGYLESAVYVANISSRDQNIMKWLDENDTTVRQLLEWSRQYNEKALH